MIDYEKLREYSYRAWLTAYKSSVEGYKNLIWFAKNRIEENAEVKDTPDA